MKKEKNKKPSHGTQEWSDFSVNIQRGCEHSCLYCYACGMANRFHRGNDWNKPTIDRQKVEKGYRLRLKEDGSVKTVMFPTSHDVTPGNLNESCTVLGKLLEAGNRVLIVSKPHIECTNRICAEMDGYQGQILFRFTIGSADDDVLAFWEPGAPTYEERVASLKLAHEQGFETSVSSEPMLDDNIHKVIEDVRPYVSNSIWLGKANRLKSTLSLNCKGALLQEALKRGSELEALQSDEKIIEIYGRYKGDEQIKWKDSIKKVVGIERPTERGLDI